MIKGMGWRADNPDIRDLRFTLSPPAVPALPRPKLLNLRSRFPGVYDQGQIGSCTGNGLAAVIEYDLRKQGLHEFVPSRLMGYFNARRLENSTASDSGASIRDVVKGALAWGICPESPQQDPKTTWPYIEAKVLDCPPDSCYTAARKTLVESYARVVPTADKLCGALASSHPIIFGVTLYESFDSPTVSSTGRVPMPTKNERALGGHCMVIVGYDDARNIFVVRNSWGKQWGDGGYCDLPYDYLMNSDLAQDFWTINSVGNSVGES